MVADCDTLISLEHEVTLSISPETQNTQFLNEIDNDFREYYYADHMNAILGVYTDLDEVTNLQCDYLETMEKYEHLKKELSKNGQFCDAELEVSFSEVLYLYRDLKGNDRLTCAVAQICIPLLSSLNNSHNLLNGLRQHNLKHEGNRHGNVKFSKPEQNGVFGKTERTLVEDAVPMPKLAKVLCSLELKQLKAYPLIDIDQLSTPTQVPNVTAPEIHYSSSKPIPIMLNLTKDDFITSLVHEDKIKGRLVSLLIRQT
ncbi:hypothetical protein Tco_0504603 [Tanacetum coccineum]